MNNVIQFRRPASRKPDRPNGEWTIIKKDVLGDLLDQIECFCVATIRHDREVAQAWMEAVRVARAVYGVRSKPA